MQAINGYLENGRIFISNETINLPKRIPVVLVFNETELDNDKKETEHAKAWREFFEDINKIDDEPLTEFERVKLVASKEI